MKRIVAVVFMIIMLISFSTPCFAESAQHDVYAKYVESTPLCGRSAVKNGIATVSLSDGMSITVSGIPSDNYVLYVKEITEDSAIQWFSQCLSDKTKVLYPFDICLLDGEDRVVLPYDVDVQITLSNRNCDKFYFLDTDGNTSIVSYNLKNSVISFKSKLDAYCVITSDTSQPVSPQTGDSSHLYLWVAIAVCGFSIVILLLYKQRKRI